jgi:ABC-type sugar transport system ATPase subunit
VFQKGVLRQVAAPQEIYADPHDLFVARFVGDPQINLIEGEIATNGTGAEFRAPGLTVRLPGGGVAGKAVFGLRPEAAVLTDAAEQGAAQGTVERIERLGGDTLLHVRIEAGPLVLRPSHSERLPEPGATIGVRPDPARALFFDDRGARIAVG